MEIEPDEESFALQKCNHRFHKECIELQFQASLNDATLFPVRCTACGDKILLDDFQVFLDEKNFQKMAANAFSKYVKEHLTEFKYCVSADCQQVFRRGGANKITCDQCGVRFCKSCGTNPPHKSVLCPTMKDIEKWMTSGNRDVKPCAHCGNLIEKNGGCMKMYCGYCTKSMCWRCGVFYASTCGEVYSHLGSCGRGSLF